MLIIEHETWIKRKLTQAKLMAFTLCFMSFVSEASAQVDDPSLTGERPAATPNANVVAQPATSTAPAEPVAKPVAPVAKPAEPVAPVAKPAEPVAPVAKPAEPVAPVAKPAEPVAPVAKPAEPVAPVAKPAEPVAPVAKPAEPVAPTAPLVSPTAPVKSIEISPKQKSAISSKAITNVLKFSKKKADASILKKKPLQQKSSKKTPPQSEIKAATCRSGNLLQGLYPIKPTHGVQRSLRMTDGYQVREGAHWTLAQTSILSRNAKATYDLGAAYALRGFTLQGDNNDDYLIYGSTDNKKYQLLWTASYVKGAGLRSREVKLEYPLAPARYLRIQAKKGDGSYSISEVRAYCEIPEAWPPKVSLTGARQKDNKDPRKHSIGVGKMGVVLFGLLVFLLPRLLTRTRDPDAADDEDAQLEDDSEPSHYWAREMFTYLIALGVAGANLWVGGVQVYRRVDVWADQGVLKGSIYHMLTSGVGSHKLTLINGLVVVVFSLALMLWTLRHLLKSTPFTRLIPALQSWGIMGVVVVFMCHADEELGKRGNWWPEGWEGLVAIGVIGAIYLLYHLLRSEGPEGLSAFEYAQRRLSGPHQRAGWMLIVACCLFTWFGFGAFHGSRLTHFWDSFHYYVGSKYFSETRYHLIYHCTTLAEYEDGRESRLKDRVLRNLTTNKYETKKSLVVKNAQHPSNLECKSHFTPERWRAFKQDIRLFRSYMGEAWWKRMFKDHGYNPTPVWTMVGTRLTQHQWRDKVPPEDLEYKPALGAKDPRSAAKKRQAHELFQKERKRFEQEIINLNLVDIALYFVIFLLYLWAFGLEITAFTLLIFGTGYPWSFDWTGGSVGRAPWLFMLASGLCFLKRGLPVLSGISLGWALLLRIFPGAILGGAAVHLGSMLFKKLEWTRGHRRFAISGIVTLITLTLASMLFVSGPGKERSDLKYNTSTAAFKEFLHNSIKHKDTPLSNNMGYQTYVKYGMNYIHIKAPKGVSKADLPFWRDQAKVRKLTERSILVLSLLLLFGAFYYLRHRWSLWEMTAASVVFLFTVFELTCYYYSFIILLTPLAYRRARDIFWLISFVVASQVVQLQIGSIKLEYVWESIFATIPIFGLLLGHVLEERRDRRSAFDASSEAPSEDGSAAELEADSESVVKA